eukprot:PhM_4_TR3499/c0_g1_i1/m.66091
MESIDSFVNTVSQPLIPVTSPLLHTVYPAATPYDEHVVANIAVYTAAVVAAHAALLPAVYRTLPPKKSAVDLLDLYFHVLYIPVLIWAAVDCVLRTQDSVVTRWSVATPSSNVFFYLYVAENLVHVPLLYASPSTSRANFVLYFFHHLFSTVSYGSGLFAQRMHYFGCLDGLCEVSSLLVNIILTWQYLSWHRGIVYTLLGLSLWLSYVVFRMALFPYWFYVYYVDVRDSPAQSVEVVMTFELLFYLLSTVLLLVLSIMWFIPITRGLIKAIKGVMPSSNSQKRE